MRMLGKFWRMVTAKQIAARLEAKRKADELTAELQARLAEGERRLELLEQNAEIMARRHGPGHPDH